MGQPPVERFAQAFLELKAATAGCYDCKEQWKGESARASAYVHRDMTKHQIWIDSEERKP